MSGVLTSFVDGVCFKFLGKNQRSCKKPFRSIRVVRSRKMLRFTNQGDSVVTLSAESDGVVECALDLGRKVELFVASNGDAYEDVARRVESAWEGAWREGKFAVSVVASYLLKFPVADTVFIFLTRFLQ